MPAERVRGRPHADTATLAGLAPETPEAIAARAEALGQRDPGRALELYREAVRRAPHRLSWWLPIAKLALELGRVEQAIKAAERVLAKHPDQAEAGILLASALLRRRDYTRMAEVLERVRKTGAQAANVANLTGTMLVQQARIGEAIAAMRPIRQLAPRSATLQMSRLMYLNYDPDLARADLFREHRDSGRHSLMRLLPRRRTSSATLIRNVACGSAICRRTFAPIRWPISWRRSSRHSTASGSTSSPTRTSPGPIA